MIGRGWQIRFYSLIFSILISFALLGGARADIYIYKDKDGILHFTDTPRHYGYRLYLWDQPQFTRYYEVSDELIRQIALRYDLHPALVKAIIKVESDFDPTAISTSGAMGLMQLKPETAREMGVTDPFSPEENIEGGVKYLKKLLYQFGGDLKRAIAAYYAGPRVVQANIERPDIKAYVEKVLYYYRIYRKHF